MSLLIDWLDIIARKGESLTSGNLEILMNRTVATHHCSESIQMIILKAKRLVDSSTSAEAIIRNGIKEICSFQSITISQRMKLLRALQGEVTGFTQWNFFDLFKDTLVRYAQIIYHADSVEKLSDVCICFLHILVCTNSVCSPASWF